MDESATPRPTTDGRGALAGGALVGLVILVLGFASGIGAVWQRGSGSLGRDLGGAVQAAPAGGDAAADVAVTAGTAANASPSSGGTTAARHSAHSSASATAGVPRAPASAGPITRAAPPPAGTDPADPSTPTACTADAASQVANPFVDHVEAAHLETAPSDQVADALDTDGYAESHTTLFGRMLEPIVALVEVTPTALGPFVDHVEAAHLETAPSDQVGDALDVDSYAEAHTTLAGDMAEPVVTSVAGTC